MTDSVDWYKKNDAYLAASLDWLRLRLHQLAATHISESEPQPNSGLLFWKGSKASQGPWRVTDKQVASAAQARSDAEQMNPPPALAILAHRLAPSPEQPLSRFEQDVLLLCAATEFDTRIAPLCALAQNDPGKPYPTFALAMALFEDPAWDVLSPERPLRFWRLIEINQPGAQPLMMSALRADERIVNYLKGLNYIDDRLTPLLTRLDAADGRPALSPSQEVTAQAVLEQFEPESVTRFPLVHLAGADSLSKRLVAIRVAQDLGRKLFRLPTDLLTKHDSELETFARLWQRDSLLLPVALYLDAHEEDNSPNSEREGSAVRRFLQRMAGLTFLSTRNSCSGLEANRIVLDVGKPTPAEQQAVWSELLKGGYESPRRLAGQFSLNIPTIWTIAEPYLLDRTTNDALGSELASQTHPHHDSIWKACLVRTRPKLDSLAQRIDTKATFDDLVVPDAQREMLWAIVGQARHRTTVYDDWGFRRMMNRGLGISALFAGESGTGKTMAAEVVANELQLDLYRIDLSGVVSKFIGETEKNLRRLFDAAEEGGATLLFDEADALFGKRSEVKDSHDRYANIEIDYLLQRMESYSGLAILATNMKSALDKAFLRRLRFVIDFSFPGVAERKQIWKKAFPSQLKGWLDYEFLSRLNLSGGSIHNIAINSAFLAAQHGLDEITMPLVLQAARAELLKLDRHISEADFRWEESKREVA